MKTPYLIAVLLLIAGIASCDDFKTIDGKEYKNVKISRVEPDGIMVITDTGIIKLFFTELPKEIQKKYHYDPKQAEEFRFRLDAARDALADEVKAANERQRQAEKQAAPSPSNQDLVESKPQQQERGEPSATKTEVGESQLNEPGEKKITVGSEIKRGASEISSAATECKEVDFLAFVVALDKVIDRNRSNNTDSEGFLLGARLMLWYEVINMAQVMGHNGFTSADGLRLAMQGAAEDFHEFRQLQKKFGLTDDQLITAAGFDSSARQEVIAQIADYATSH